MKRFYFLIFLFPIILFSQANTINRSAQLLDLDCFFINKDILNGELKQKDYSCWEKVRISHKWAINGNFDMNLDAQYVQVSEDNDK